MICISIRGFLEVYAVSDIDIARAGNGNRTKIPY